MNPTTCATGDCDSPIDPNGFIRLNDCDCLGDPDVFPNCCGHAYCDSCTWALCTGGEMAGCVACSSASCLTIHGRGVPCPLSARMTDRCARCGAFLGELYDLDDMKVCDACDYTIALRGAIEDMTHAWAAYDDEDDEVSRRWEDDMNAAVKRASALLLGIRREAQR